jgi:hypothetical protein
LLAANSRPYNPRVTPFFYIKRTGRKTMKKQTLAAMMACLMLAGCGGEESDIKKALVARYEKPLCVEVGNAIPFTIVTDSPFGGAPDKAWVTVLEKAGIVKETATSQRGSGPMAIKQTTYDVTSKGKKVQQGNKLCYGQTKFVKLVEYSKPREQNGATFISAKSLLKYEITEEWAKDPAFRNRVKSGEQSMNDDLVKTNKGWSMDF